MTQIVRENHEVDRLTGELDDMRRDHAWTKAETARLALENEHLDALLENAEHDATRERARLQVEITRLRAENAEKAAYSAIETERLTNALASAVAEHEEHSRWLDEVGAVVQGRISDPALVTDVCKAIAVERTTAVVEAACRMILIEREERTKIEQVRDEGRYQIEDAFRELQDPEHPDTISGTTVALAIRARLAFEKMLREDLQHQNKKAIAHLQAGLACPIYAYSQISSQMILAMRTLQAALGICQACSGVVSGTDCATCGGTGRA